MIGLFVFAALAVIGGFFLSRRAATVRANSSGARMHSRAGYHGYLAGWLIGIPTFVVLSLLLTFAPDMSRLVA